MKIKSQAEGSSAGSPQQCRLIERPPTTVILTEVRATPSEPKGSKGEWKDPDTPVLCHAALKRSLKRSWSAGALACGLNIMPHDIFRAPKSHLQRHAIPSRSTNQTAYNIRELKMRRRGNCSAAADKTRHLFNPVILTDSTDPERGAKGPYRLSPCLAPQRQVSGHDLSVQREMSAASRGLRSRAVRRLKRSFLAPQARAQRSGAQIKFACCSPHMQTGTAKPAQIASWGHLTVYFSSRQGSGSKPFFSAT